MSVVSVPAPIPVRIPLREILPWAIFTGVLGLICCIFRRRAGRDVYRRGSYLTSSCTMGGICSASPATITGHYGHDEMLLCEHLFSLAAGLLSLVIRLLVVSLWSSLLSASSRPPPPVRHGFRLQNRKRSPGGQSTIGWPRRCGVRHCLRGCFHLAVRHRLLRVGRLLHGPRPPSWLWRLPWVRPCLFFSTPHPPAVATPTEQPRSTL